MASLDRLFSLAGKKALITGAGSGIGKTIAAQFAEAGAEVICNGRTPQQLEDAAHQIRLKGGQAHALAFDVSDEAQVETAFAEIAATVGVLDILVCNAAVLTKHDFLTASAESWDTVQETNLRGAFLCAREAVKLMLNRGGVILNIASVAALHPAVFGNAQYGASKAALLALTRSLALEFAADGIRCNAIAPGAVLTEVGGATREKQPVFGPFAQPSRILLNRIGKPDDIATAALYLASDASSYVTGRTLVVDGSLMIG